VSVLMTLSDRERRNERGQFFRRIFRRISVITLEPFGLERPNLAR